MDIEILGLYGAVTIMTLVIVYIAKRKADAERAMTKSQDGNV